MVKKILVYVIVGFVLFSLGFGLSTFIGGHTGSISARAATVEGNNLKLVAELNSATATIIALTSQLRLSQQTDSQLASRLSAVESTNSRSTQTASEIAGSVGKINDSIGQLKNGIASDQRLIDAANKILSGL